MRYQTLKLKLTVSLILEVLIAFSAFKAWAGNVPERSFDTESLSVKHEQIEIKTQKQKIIQAYVPNTTSQDSEAGTENESNFFNPEFPLLNQTQISKASTLILSQRPDISPPTPLPPTPPPQPIPEPQPLPTPPLEETPSPPTEPSPRPEIPGSITISKFEFEGNTAFSDEKLNAAIANFLNRPIAFSELLQVENVITDLYTKAGYINSGAVIPADQTLPRKGAVVKVQIIEGGIEDIKITGTNRLNPNYVRSRIALATSKPLNRDRLLEALQLLQLDPLIANISAELSAGSRPELSLLEVNVREADSSRTEFFADNDRDPSVGSFRRGVRFNEGNLFGFGDRLALEYTNSDGSNTYDFKYTVPINARNGTIAVGIGKTDVEVIKEPFDRIDIESDYSYFDLTVRQPFVQTPTQEVALGLTLSTQDSETELLGEGFPLSPGADEEGQTRVSALRFFQEYTQRNPQQVFALRSQFSLGVGWFDATVNDDPPDSRFLAWRGQGQYVRLLAPETLLVLRSDIQLATRPLVPIEQFRSGGLQSVRGYGQDQLLTDNGLFASAEVRLPILQVEKVQGVLQLAPFIDFGIGWNNSDSPDQDPDPNTLVGIGLGLQWQMGDYLNARIDYGVPLTEADDRYGTLQEQGFYFSVNYSPF
ncbi:MAG: ShlB/FhaC/HecB family hemolysin secretion/activation protein [Fischerella sp.]|jgi:hemolysin activation/secretion protein|uniref:ShlB/FhaC/HecB family hemolysin secretion/activation protein n=1 Tax=Fischerella sp. TaxID=1191 RepID=UPI0017DCE4C0|nr:ShlB/FhaC/HecB family hemolysin secretion/activation protein [Fischerella sp.]NWF62533.1 ShlB/FhaC/HecB family hemolysin secretion/activation protein [Fischerella sp.]